MNNAQLDPSKQALKIIRVNNGWVVCYNRHMDYDISPMEFVAETPENLLKLIYNWACEQHLNFIEANEPKA